MYKWIEYKLYSCFSDQGGAEWMWMNKTWGKEIGREDTIQTVYMSTVATGERQTCYLCWPGKYHMLASTFQFICFSVGHWQVIKVGVDGGSDMAQGSLFRETNWQIQKFKQIASDYIQRMTKQTLKKYYVIHVHQVRVVQMLTETFELFIKKNYVHFLIGNFFVSQVC